MSEERNGFINFALTSEGPVLISFDKSVMKTCVTMIAGWLSGNYLIKAIISLLTQTEIT